MSTIEQHKFSRYPAYDDATTPIPRILQPHSSLTFRAWRWQKGGSFQVSSVSSCDKPDGEWKTVSGLCQRHVATFATHNQRAILTNKSPASRSRSTTFA